VRDLLLGVAVAACALGAGPAGARGARFARIAASVAAFASDGTRYVAWQTTSHGPIVVFDTLNGKRRTVVDGCRLRLQYRTEREYDLTESTGLFLVKCPHEELLDVRTGALRQLPAIAGAEEASEGGGASGPALGWEVVGRRYVLGGAPEGMCHQSSTERRRQLNCVALYDLASEKVSYRPQSQWPNIDQAGAPPLCPRLRAKLLKLIEETEEPEAAYGFSDQRIARPAGKAGNVELSHCDRPATVIAATGGRYRAEGSEPLSPEQDLDPRGAFLTWDTAIGGEEFGVGAGSINHGRLWSYNLGSGQLVSWALPRQTFSNPGLRVGVTGILGYSSHTNYMVIWIAVRSLHVDTLGYSTEASSVYVARI